MQTQYVTLKIVYDPETCDSPVNWDWKSLVGEDEYTESVEVWEFTDDHLDAASHT